MFRLICTPLDRLVYDAIMLEAVFQFLAVYLFAAMPCFAGWIANGGMREDVGIPVVASIVLTLVFLFLLIFIAWTERPSQIYINRLAANCD